MVVDMTIKSFVDESLEMSFDTINFLNVKKEQQLQQQQQRKTKKEKRGKTGKKEKSISLMSRERGELNINTYSNVCLSLQTAWTVTEKGLSSLHPSPYVSSET